MTDATTVARRLAGVPAALLTSVHTKVSLLLGAHLGLTVGALSRAEGTRPAPIIAQVRSELFTADGGLTTAGAQPSTPLHRAAADAVGPWITEPVIETPDWYAAGMEQYVLVPFMRALLNIIEVAAGAGYAAAGVVPAPVLAYGGFGVILLYLVAQLRSLFAGVAADD